MAKARDKRGRLFTRGKKGRYYLQFYLNGKQIVQRLADEQGHPITSIRKAEAARDRVLAPYLAKDEVQLRQQAINALRSAEEAAKEAEEAARDKLKLVDVWDKYPYEYRTRGKNQNGRDKKQKLADSTIKDNRYQWDKFVCWFTSHAPDRPFVDDVTEEDARAYSEYLRVEEERSGNRHNKLILCAGVMLRAATERDPFAAVPAFDDKPSKSYEDADPETVVQAMENSSGEYRRLICIGAFTGLRLKDACLLEWGTNVSTDLKELRRETSKRKKHVYFDLHPYLASELANVSETARRGYVCPELAADYEAGRKPKISRAVADLLTSGAAIEMNEVESEKPEATQKRTTFHCLRATFATVCCAAGVPIDHVQEWLGHSCPTVTQIYNKNRKAAGSQDILKALSGAFKLTTEQLPVNSDDSARADLHRLADSLPVKDIQALLKYAKNRQQKKLTPAKA